MKIKLTCNNCGESFNIEINYLKDKTSIICPNCSKEFPKDSFQKFKTALINLNEVSNSLNETDDCFESAQWEFEIL